LGGLVSQPWRSCQWLAQRLFKEAPYAKGFAEFVELAFAQQDLLRQQAQEGLVLSKDSCFLKAMNWRGD